MAESTVPPPGPISHPGETRSNDFRQRAAKVEPACLRTYTPSQAVITKSAGAFHWTPEGRKLADFSSGVLVANLGYNMTRWWKRVLDYMQLGGLGKAGDFCEAVPLTAYNAIAEIEVVACERLLANLRKCPGGGKCEQVLWAASGSEAIQKALWAALDRRPGEDIILATRGGFHGKKGLAGATTGTETDEHRDPRVRFISFPMDECIDPRRRSKPIRLKPYEQELARLKEELGHRICALITEPYLGAAGSFHPQKEYLQLLQQFCNENDIVFILDEVQSSFGRTGQMYAYVTYGIEPDIVILGKGLGNGIPVSAAVGRRDLFAAMHYGEGSDTFSANPLSAAAVLATLDEFENTDIVEHVQKLEKVIRRGLLRLQDELRIVARIRGEGAVWGIECAACGKLDAPAVANACVEACYRGDESGRAIHLLGPLAKKVIRVSPPLVLSLDDAKEYLDVLYNIIASVQKRLSK